MKKILIMSLFALLITQGCKKGQELINNEKPEERAAKELEKYKNELINSPNGWIAHLHTTEIKGDYSFYMDFKPDNVLNIRADFDENSINTEQVSTYRLKKVMATSLIFDTDNYLHALIDPDSKRGGLPGLGFGSDTEFEIMVQTGDTLKLVGKRRKTRLTLVKATTAFKNFYAGGELAEISNYIQSNQFLYLTDQNDPAKKIQISFGRDLSTRKVNLSSLTDGTVTSAEQIFSYGLSGILMDALDYGGRSFIGFQWDKVNKKLFALTSNGPRIEVLRSDIPILPLHLLIGVNHPSIIVPNEVIFPGWSTDFQNRRARASGNLPYDLRLEEMLMEFDAAAKKILLTAIIPQNSTVYYAEFEYSYTKTNAGIFKFTVNPQYRSLINSGYTDNANLIQPAMASLLAQRLNADRFTLEYFVDPVSKVILAQFKSIEHPDFTFTGTL